MCTPNYWDDIVETRNSHEGNAEFEAWYERSQRSWRRRLGLSPDAPKWLSWKVTIKPHGHQKHPYMEAAKVALRQQMVPLRQGEDFDDLVFETRASRLDDRRWWY